MDLAPISVADAVISFTGMTGKFVPSSETSGSNSNKAISACSSSADRVLTSTDSDSSDSKSACSAVAELRATKPETRNTCMAKEIASPKFLEDARCLSPT